MSTTTREGIYFRHARKVIVPESDVIIDVVSSQLLATFLKNVESYGYTLDYETICKIQSKTDLGTFVRFAKNFTNMLKNELGAHVSHDPMYINFPAQVMEADAAELYLNAVIHYVGSAVGLRIMPLYEKEERTTLTEFKNLELIGLGSDDDFITVFSQLVGSKLALSETDAEDVKWFVNNYKDTPVDILLVEISNKENLATLAGIVYNVNKDAFAEILALTKTATDVLRVAAAVSGSNSSLSDGTRFANFPKAVRRALLDRLNVIGVSNGIDALIEDMLRNRAIWKMLGEKIHPGDYAKRFPLAFEAFATIRDSKSGFITFGGRVELAILNADVSLSVKLLSTRPGELARRLDHLLRLGVNCDVVVDAFSKVANKVATNVLWQVRSNFIHRNDIRDENSLRTFFPKGSISKIRGIENTLPAIAPEYTDKIVNIVDSALSEIYSKKESLGKVYIDSDLSRFVIPSSVRSASRSLNVVGRGTRSPINTEDTLRFFIWWKQNESQADIDLTAMMMDKNFDNCGSIGYYNLRGVGATHSGDITSAPDGASEYIDIDVEKLKSDGVRYVLMVINSYSQQPFIELSECFAGVMARNGAQSGEVFEPRTVENIFDVTADSMMAIPLIIDLETMESVWADLSINNNSVYLNNVPSNQNSLTLAAKAILSMQRPSLFDLFFAHAEARGTLVYTLEEADTVFSVENGRVSVSATEILSDFL